MPGKKNEGEAMRGSKMLLLAIGIQCVIQGAGAFQAPSLGPVLRAGAIPTPYSARSSLAAAGLSLKDRSQARSMRHARQSNSPGLLSLRSQAVESFVPALIQGLGSGLGSISGVLVLGGVIAFHEAGHFLAARVQGITVQDFSIGFGPKVVQFEDKEGISYSLRALPLGGFVSFPEALTDEEKADMDEEDLEDLAEMEKREGYIAYDINDPNLLQNRPVAQRALVLSAGVIFNMILSFGAILITVVSGGVMEPILKPGVQVPAIVAPDGAGARYGMKAGDVVLGVNGVPLTADAGATSDLVQSIKSSGGKTIHFDILRTGEKMALDVTPDKTRGGDGIIGVKLTPYVEKVSAVMPQNPIDALVITSKEFVRIFGQTLTGFGKILSNMGSAAGSMAGPVGVMQMGAEAGQQGALLTFAALISINLGIMNALPLPALDGGQMVFLAVEAATGKAVEPRTMRRINGVAISVLLAISLGLLFTDIEKLVPLSWRL